MTGLARVADAQRIIVGFDFYGAGNVGDDLMLAGLRVAMDRLLPGRTPEILAATRWNRESQARRFPSMRWLTPAEFDAELAHSDLSASAWLGVGGTPFQLCVGPWMLNHLTSAMPTMTRFGMRVMMGVGAETEIMPRAAEFARIAGAMQRISVRDAMSGGVVRDMLGVGNDRLHIGSDLAHLALEGLSAEPMPRPTFALGLVPAADRWTQADLAAIADFVLSLPRDMLPVAIIVNEVRRGDGFERTVVESLAAQWPEFRRRIVMLVPPYDDGALGDLIAPTALCHTVLTSRYHGVLAAAWTGARIGVIGRSSKLVGAADDLGLPRTELPLTSDALRGLLDSARSVPRDKLHDLSRLALRGAAFALGVDSGG